MRRLVARLPAGLSERLARHAVPLTVALVGLLLVGGVATAALVSPGALGITAARLSETSQLPETLQAAGLAERDTDQDGVSDSLENYLYGTSPNEWNSSGLGIPDGWLVQFGFDPLSPLTRAARGAAPPADALPDAYKDGYPAAFTPPLRVYYEYAKPADYVPGESAPWWRAGEHASPSEWDQTRTGIPTGWLIHHGLRLAELDPDAVAPGSAGNLTVREAFEHNTHPLLADSDADGLDDWVEIHVTRTDPAKLSTADTDIADGWLLHFGLDAFNPDVASQDPDMDGLTNREEFLISHGMFHAEVEENGIAHLYDTGLNPLEWETARTGIPDGWYVKYDLSPFGTDVDLVIGRASDFPEYRTFTPEGDEYEPLPDFVFTVRSAYEYARPSEWNESTDGVWWGGTNPVTLDTDNDGLPDPVEIRGWYANVTFDTGPEGKPRVYLATSNPLEPDSDGDGLTDLEEYRGRTPCNGDVDRDFPPTDPRNRDTAFSGLTDFEKVCGALRGDVRYDLPSTGAPGERFLDPTRADSAGDYMKDGPRLEYWHRIADGYRATAAYPYEESAFSTVLDWTSKYARFGSLTRDETLAQFRPDGDVDGDGLANVLDADPAGGLYAERWADPGTPKDNVFFLGGPQIDPALYRLTEFASVVPHSQTDPANPDTDGDGLPDAWETRYGRFDPVLNGWDLDPAKADSDGDGVTDDAANNDGDVVTWYAFNRGGAGGIDRTTHRFEFDNGLEFVADTNPNEASTSGDGVPDGWKAFWGSRIVDGTFPNLIAARDPSVGDVALAAADEIEDALATSRIAPTADLTDAGAKSTGYARLVNVTACGSAELYADLVREGERLEDVSCYSGRNLEGKQVNILRIVGVHTLTYAEEAELRTNPYMTDTDGDGAPDAYEVHYMIRTPGGSAYPDPANADGTRDPDEDGIGVVDECASVDGGRRCGVASFELDGEALGIGSDPNNDDTDNDGIQDGIEFNAGLDATDPADVESFSDPSRQSDADRIPDYQELTGWGKTEFGVPVRTDPQDHDTDGDGLLDGITIVLDPVENATLVATLRAEGIAHRTLNDGRIEFLGERIYGAAFGLRPDVMFSAVEGVPDAWLAYYNLNPNDRPVDDTDYKVHRPDWWNEAIHSVWWWGTPPNTVPSHDLDGDGLHDANGEDPFPATNRFNRVTDGGVTITDPADLEAFVNEAGSAEDVRRRAQLVGDGAGDPASARAAARSAVNPETGVPLSKDRACVEIVDLAVPSEIEKGAAFNVTGRVVFDDCAGSPVRERSGERTGVPNRTVHVSFFRPDAGTLVGANFTGEDGAFHIEANVTSSHRVELPAPGMTLMGAVDGAASWTFDPALVTPGTTTAGVPNRVVVWVTNTTWDAQPDDATHVRRQAWLPDQNGQHALRFTNATAFAARATDPVTVTATTALTTSVGGTVENGDTLVGDVRLSDASGAPIASKPVVVKWTGSTAPVEFHNLTTDRNGVVNLTRLGIRAGVPSSDQFAIIATFTSDDTFLGSVETTFPVRVRHPTTLTVETDSPSVTVGDLVTVSGTLRTVDVALPDGSTVPAEPVPDAEVRIVLGGVSEATVTDDRGRFSIGFPVPGSLVAGTQTLQAFFDGTDDHGLAGATTPLTVKRTANIVDLSRIEGPRTAEAGLRGRLVDNAGQGFKGAVEVHSEAAGVVAHGLAGDDGRFTIPVALQTLPLGSQQLRVAFPGDPTHGTAENFTQARVTSAARLVIESAPDQVVRGDAMTVKARLVDDRGDPVVRQPVAVSWRGERVDVIVTDDEGRVSKVIQVNASERPARLPVAFQYTPPTNAVYQAAGAGHDVRIVAGSNLELSEGSVHRGPVSVSGRLLDDEGRPIPGAGVTVTFAERAFGEARTTRNGSFEITRNLPADFPLGNANVVAEYDGTETLAGDAANATWHVRSPRVLDLAELAPIIRGETATVAGEVTDDAGKPVDVVLNVTLAGTTLPEIEVVGGALRHTLQVPVDLPRGATELVLRAPGDERYDAFELRVPVIVKIRPQIEVELPALTVRGFAFGGEVRLFDDKGEPLRNTTFVYLVGSERGVVTGETDAEGKATLASVAPITGEATLALTVRGGEDVLPTEYTTSSLRVVGPATPIGYAGLVVAVLGVLVLVGGIIAIAMLRRRQLTEARDIIEEAIKDLLAGNEYSGTVFLCYRRFTAHLARHGYVEKASQTPREFAVGVRKALPIGTGPLRRFIQVFEEARYSDHAIGSQERDVAVEHLASVRNELDRLLGKGVNPS